MTRALATSLPVVPHVRPRSAARAGYAGAAVLELADADALTAALRPCTTILQLIGTVRARFAAGDTYETSDIGSTRLLADSGRAAGVDHIVLLSSVGAGNPRGAYFRAKAEAERLCRDSGIPATVFRPSFLDGPGRKAPWWAKVLAAPLGARWRVMPLDALARALLHAAMTRSHLGEVLEGRSLWDAVREAQDFEAPRTSTAMLI
jgi:uncharacterized protein YbjT (DUF2867 family)